MGVFNDDGCLLIFQVHLGIDSKMNEVQRQLDAKGKKSAARTEELNRDRERYHDHIITLQEWFKELFQGVFLPRFRDAVPVIRQECIKSLGGWMARLPYFLEDQYLKYIGWLFNDKVLWSAPVSSVSCRGSRSRLGRSFPLFSPRDTLTRNRPPRLAGREGARARPGGAAQPVHGRGALAHAREVCQRAHDAFASFFFGKRFV